MASDNTDQMHQDNAAAADSITDGFGYRQQFCRPSQFFPLAPLQCTHKRRVLCLY